MTELDVKLTISTLNALECELDLGGEKLWASRMVFAREALRKQLPAPVKNYSDICGTGNCPHCKTLLRYEKFCPECGQAIDWRWLEQ